MRHLIGIGTPRGLQGRVAAVLATLGVLMGVVRRRLTTISSSHRLIPAVRGRLASLATFAVNSSAAITCTTGCYAIGMPANTSLELEIEDILFRPPGRPSCKPLVRYKSFRHQAKSWTTAKRIVTKVEHHRGELFPCLGFIVTNMALPSRSIVRCYNKRGTAEPWIKEGQQATHWTRLSCHRFRANEVRLHLRVLAYNLGNL